MFRFSSPFVCFHHKCSPICPFFPFGRDFEKKKAPRPDFVIIHRSVVEAKMLRTSSAAYKKQSERFLSLSKAPLPPENEADEGVPLVKKRKVDPAGASISAPQEEAPPQARSGVTVAAPSTVPQAIVPITAYFAEGPVKMKQKRPANASANGKATDFLGSKDDDLSEAVLEMLPPETTSAVRLHSKYWTDDWANHASSCGVEDLMAANNAYVARALSMGAAAEDLVKALRKRNDELEERLKASETWEAEVAKARKEVEEVKEKWITTATKLDAAEIQVNQYKNELHESVSQAATLTKRIDAGKIASLEAEVKAVGEAVVQDYKDNFDKTLEYDDFANYWASWAAQEMISRLRERHANLDIGFLEEEFGGPTRGRPVVEEEAFHDEAETPQEEGVGAIINVD
ncbi:unnamed protein product [Fraxinus pennsylvanica]|uniref:Uncharacterized protein n=1 Tax=Fraxinus pennsylvanica TaxID=56036 RepID=A0AAD2DW93_9LAMI|nr:unnamed protein product [Fraxinus pennsylvanica]